MWSRAAYRDQLVTNPARKRKVGYPIAVQMPELPPAKTKLDATEAMRPDLDSWPRLHGAGDPLGRSSLVVAHELAPKIDINAQVRPASSS